MNMNALELQIYKVQLDNVIERQAKEIKFWRSLAYGATFAAICSMFVLAIILRRII